MIDQLSEDKWEAGSSLKDYLSYFDFDLSEQVRYLKYVFHVPVRGFFF